MKWIIAGLVFFWAAVSCQTGGSQYEIIRTEGSGLQEEGSGEFPTDFIQEDFDYHEVNDITEGKSEVTDMSEVVGPQFLISRRVENTEDQQISCECHCLDELTYHHEDTVNTKQIDFVLRDENRGVELCSPDQFSSCCRDYRGQARFRFPDSEPLLPPLPVSETVLVGTVPAPRPSHTVPQGPDTTQTTSCEADLLSSVRLGESSVELEETVGSKSHWFVLLELSEPARVSLILSSRTAVALLVRRSHRPTLKEFDILDVLDGPGMEAKMFWLTGGSWYLRLSNEEPFSVDMLLTVSVSDLSPEPPSSSSHCPLVYGELSCPGQCLHGLLLPGGGCHCLPGWLGPLCEVSLADCSSQICNHHGDCDQDLTCVCHQGHRGPHCDQVLCPQDCADNGVCLNGTCKCFSGFEGVSCNITSTPSLEVVCPDRLLAEEAVLEECGAGWGGEDCSTALCDPRCSLHGECQAGTCVCQPGWSGAHCTLDLCPGACSGHGTCTSQGGTWTCSCQSNWAGADCSIQLETSCSDGLDNDHGKESNC